MHISWSYFHVSTLGWGPLRTQVKMSFGNVTHWRESFSDWWRGNFQTNTELSLMRVKQPLVSVFVWIQTQQHFQTVFSLWQLCLPFYTLKSLIDSIFKQLAINPTKMVELQIVKFYSLFPAGTHIARTNRVKGLSWVLVNVINYRVWTSSIGRAFDQANIALMFDVF